MADRIPCLVFSRDRAMQLDLLLSSLERNAAGLFDVTVLYHPTGPAFDLAYLDCLKDHPWVAPMRERDFRADVLDWLDTCEDSHVAFLVDDDVLYRKTPPIGWLPGGGPWLPDNIVSLRLGVNTTYCYTMDDENRLPPVGHCHVSGGWVSWFWEDEDATNDYAYPLSLDGHLIPRKWILPLLDFDWRNPTQLEAGLHGRRGQLPARRLISPVESCLVNIPANRVSATGGNRHAAVYAVGWLNERYLAGDRIDLDALSFNRVRSPHQEIPLRFRSARRTLVG